MTEAPKNKPVGWKEKLEEIKKHVPKEEQKETQDKEAEQVKETKLQVLKEQGDKILGLSNALNKKITQIHKEGVPRMVAELEGLIKKENPTEKDNLRIDELEGYFKEEVESLEKKIQERKNHGGKVETAEKDKEEVERLKKEESPKNEHIEGASKLKDKKQDLGGGVYSEKEEIKKYSIEEEKKDKKIAMLTSRDFFISKYKDYLKTRRLRESIGISEKEKDWPDDLKDLMNEYRNDKIAYMQSSYRNRRKELFDDMPDMSDVEGVDIEKAKETNKIMDEEYFSAKIFNEVELSQQEEIQKVKIEALTDKEKNLFNKGLQWYSERSRVSKLIFFTAIATGAAVGSGAFAGASIGVGAAAGAYAGQRIARGVVGGFAGHLFGNLAGKIGERTVRKVEEETEKDFKKEFDLHSLNKMESLSQARINKIESTKKRALIAKALVAISAGMIAGRATLELVDTGTFGEVAKTMEDSIDIKNPQVDGSLSENTVGLDTDSVQNQMLMDQTRGMGGQVDMLDDQASGLKHIPGQSGHGAVDNLQSSEVTAKSSPHVYPEKFVGNIEHHSVIEKGGNIWDSARGMVKDPDEFNEAWKNSTIHLPGQEEPIHISEVNLVHPGTVVEYVSGEKGAPGHFEVLAPEGQILPGIDSQATFTESIHTGLSHGAETVPPEMLKIADDVMQKKIEDIYKYKFLFFGGSQIEEWVGNPDDGIVGIKDMPVENILKGNFGEPFGGGLDAAQGNNRDQLLEFLNGLKTEVNPIPGETTENYVRRALAIQISATEEGAKVLNTEALSGIDGNTIEKSIAIDNIDIKSNVVNGVVENNVVVNGELKGYTGIELLSKDYLGRLNSGYSDHSLLVESVKNASNSLSLKLAAYEQLQSEGLKEKADILLKNIHEDVSMYDKRFGSGVIDNSKIPGLK